MEINKKDLTEALELVKPGLAGKELIQQSTSFAFMNGSIITYNDEISVQHPFTFGDKKLTGAVNAEEFYLFLNKVKTDIITLEVTGSEVLFKSGRTRAGFTMESEIVLPINQIGKRSTWEELPGNFCSGLSLAMGAAGRDMSRPVLTCVCVDQQGTITASDGFKIMHYVLGTNLPTSRFLIPATSAVHIVRLQPTEIAEGKGWIHFKTQGGTIMSCRTFEDEYPYEKMMGYVDFDSIELELPKITKELIERASVFYKREHILDETVNVDIAKRSIKISAKSDTGWSEEDANIKYDGDPISFSITPYLLKGILDQTTTLHLGKNMIKFEIEDTWTYVARLKGE